MGKIRDSTVWVDTKFQFYPRLLDEDTASEFSDFVDHYLLKTFTCVHRRPMCEPCVACEGLSILEGTRR